MKARTCPNCQKTIPIDNGFHFDDVGSLICAACNKVVIPATTAVEPMFYPLGLQAGQTQTPYSHWNAANM